MGRSLIGRVTRRLALVVALVGASMSFAISGTAAAALVGSPVTTVAAWR